jgi:uncharacterized membrane protein YhaH (DUF805 family)
MSKKYLVFILVLVIVGFITNALFDFKYEKVISIIIYSLLFVFYLAILLKNRN